MRDHRKATIQLEALGDGPKPTPQKLNTYTLVVCGATNLEHGWMFSDFMAACMVFKEAGEGSFLSGFSIQGHFIDPLSEQTGLNQA